MSFTLCKNPQENSSLFISHLDSMTNLFNDNQKEIVILSLYLLANSDGQFDNDEKELLSLILAFTKYRGKSFPELLSSYMNNFDSYFDQLINWSEPQKDSYLYLLYCMYAVDRKFQKIKLDTIEKLFLLPMNIGLSKFEASIIKRL